MTKLMGHNKWTASRRFGVLQGLKKLPNGESKIKIRQIDDLSEFMVNACATIGEKVEVDGVDKIANMIKMWADLIAKAKKDPHRKIRIKLSTGKELTGTMHNEFARKGMKLKGACLDLEAAYKQCPVHPSDHHCAIFAIKNPGTRAIEFFRMNSLPFGAAAAVHGFNRAAKAINVLTHEYAKVPCTNYFDDFTIVGPEHIIKDMIAFMKELVGIIGWEFKEDKEAPAATTNSTRWA